MRIKLDENLGQRIAAIFRAAGHDATTVHEQGVQGIDDHGLYELCRNEERCLVTVDLDFSNVLRFPPEQTFGIVVLRPGPRAAIAALRVLAGQTVRALAMEAIAGRLWIVEHGRIRIHQAPEIKG